MTSFIEAIAQNAKDVQKARSIGKNPFKCLVRSQGGYKEIMNFKCDTSYTSTKELKHLCKYVPYIKLVDLSQKYSRRAHFTIACICEVRGFTFLISDLKHVKRIMIAKNLKKQYRNHDIIAIANSDIDKVISINDDDQIIKIGHCDFVEKCRKFSDDDRCCGYVDKRNGPTCNFHCIQMVKNSGSRMLLRQIPTPIQWDNLNSSLMRDEQIFNMPPMEKMSSSVVDNYIEAHPNGRSAKFAKEIERQKKELEMRNNNSPRIGAGFENGGIILL